jgi:hypothetical protein
MSRKRVDRRGVVALAFARFGQRYHRVIYIFDDIHAYYHG